MNWILIFLIGFIVGWLVEYLFDLWFWGRRNQALSTKLAALQSRVRAAEQQVVGAQTIITEYHEKEREFLQCQFDLDSQDDKYAHLNALAQRLGDKLKSSHRRVGHLTAQVNALERDRETLHATLEDVDRWALASLARNGKTPVAKIQEARKAVEQKVADAQSMARTAGSRLGEAATRFATAAAITSSRTRRQVAEFRAEVSEKAQTQPAQLRERLQSSVANARDGIRANVTSTSKKIGDRVRQTARDKSTQVRESVSAGVSRAKSEIRRKAASTQNRAANRVATVTGRVKHAVSQAWPVRIFKRGYCAAWAMVAMVNKNITAPRSCSIGS